MAPLKYAVHVMAEGGSLTSKRVLMRYAPFVVVVVSALKG